MIILFFAAARGAAGVPSAEFAVPTESTVAELRYALAERYPKLAPLLPSCRIAIDREFADDTMRIPSGAEVAVIPPVSGG